MIDVQSQKQKRKAHLEPQEAAEGRMALNNFWNGVNGMVSTCLMCSIPFQNSIPGVTTSPIKVTPATCV